MLTSSSSWWHTANVQALPSISSPCPSIVFSSFCSPSPDMALSVSQSLKHTQVLNSAPSVTWEHIHTATTLQIPMQTANPNRNINNSCHCNRIQAQLWSSRYSSLSPFCFLSTTAEAALAAQGLCAQAVALTDRSHAKATHFSCSVVSCSNEKEHKGIPS